MTIASWLNKIRARKQIKDYQFKRGDLMTIVAAGQTGSDESTSARILREPEIAKIPNKKRTDCRFLYIISSSKRYINNFRFP